MSTRIGAFLILLIAVFVGPWWFLPLCALGYAFYFDDAYELLLVAFLLEVSYGAGVAPLPYIYLTGAAVFLLLASYLKPRLAL